MAAMLTTRIEIPPEFLCLRRPVGLFRADVDRPQSLSWSWLFVIHENGPLKRIPARSHQCIRRSRVRL